jgi:hypothetical protein
MKTFSEYLENNFLNKALDLMNTVGSQPSTLQRFRPGLHVIILNPDFSGEEAVVTGTTTNTFNKPLVLVRRPNTSRDLCFYPGELKITSEMN